MSLDRAPVRETCLQVLVTGGTSNTGSITFTGTVGGAAGQTETLTFTGASTRVTSKQFTAVSGFTTTGLADEATPPTVSIQATGADGSIQEQMYAVKGPGYPYFLVEYYPRWPGKKMGTVEMSQTMVQYVDDGTWTPKPGDIWQDNQTGEEWQIQGPMRRNQGSYGSMFYLMTASKRQQTV